MRASLLRLVPVRRSPGALGAVLLLVLDPDLFRAIVPVLIVIGVGLVVGGPRLNAWTARRREASGSSRPSTVPRAGRRARGRRLRRLLRCGAGHHPHGDHGSPLRAAAAAPQRRQERPRDGRQRRRGRRLRPVARDRIDWLVVLLIAVGSTLGGVLGSTVGRRLPSPSCAASSSSSGSSPCPGSCSFLMDPAVLAPLAVRAVVQSVVGFDVVGRRTVRRPRRARPHAGRLVPSVTLPVPRLSHGVRDLAWRSSGSPSPPGCCSPRSVSPPSPSSHPGPSPPSSVSSSS